MTRIVLTVSLNSVELELFQSVLKCQNIVQCTVSPSDTVLFRADESIRPACLEMRMIDIS